jgi:hypothetical protein
MRKKQNNFRVYKIILFSKSLDAMMRDVMMMHRIKEQAKSNRGITLGRYISGSGTSDILLRVVLVLVLELLGVGVYSRRTK